MKNIIERIAGGAKIARYLPKAVSTRLAIAALAALAAGGAWATDSLEETGGFITDTSTLAFKGVSLSELTADTLSGRFGGAGAGTASGTFATFNNFDRSSEGSGSISCEAQVADDGWVKGVILTFTQSGEDVYVVKTAGKYKSGSAVGPSVSDGTSENPSYPYAIYNLALPRTGYGAATVVWEKGQFGLTKTGTDGNSYSFSNIDGTDNVAINASGAIEVSSGATKGAIVTLPSGAVNVAVLVKYSGLATKSSLVTPVGMHDDASHNIGIRTTGESTLAVKGYYNNDSNVYPSSGTLTSMPEGSGYFLATYNCRNAGSNYFNFYAGSTLPSLAGGSCTSLRFTDNSRKLSSIAVGGPTATGGKASPWDGLVIEKVAIFVLETNTASASSSSSPYTNTDVANYYWPSAKEKYSKFSYIPAARRLTWTTASTVTGDNIPNANTQYAVFDIQSGDDTATTYDGGTSGNGNWTKLCQANGAYSAPGTLLRFTSGAYAKTLHGTFSPLTLGGIIVEKGATGYNFSTQSRYSNFGDPTNTAETYFDFYEDFTFNRNSGCHLDGTINIMVASGKTFTIAGTTIKSATTTAASGNVFTYTAGGTLKLHGGGHLAATLTASDATLDYTDLSTTVSSSSDAYIQGTLTVNSGTVIALPAGATFPYYIATGISGSLNAATGVTIGGEAAPYYQANAAGYIEHVAPSAVTISSNATWGSGDLTGWATDDATKDYIINVTADATLTLPSAVSCKTIVFNVSDGVTLTLDGTYAITATDEIEINGANGAVVSPSTSALSGTLQGNGVYWLKNATLTGFSAATIADADLTLRLTGCTGYFNGNTTSPGTLDLQDDGETKAFTISNCSSSTAGAIVFAKLTGSGTFTASNADVFPRYAFTNPSSFTGTFAIPASVAGKTLGDSGFRPVRIILGAHGTLDPDKGTITVVSSTTASIAAGKTWTAPGGIEVDGTLNLGAGATAPKLKSGSDGMVVVASGGTATVSGIDSSAISPTLGIMGTLAFSDTTTTELTLTAEKLSNNGTLDLSGCTAVTTMNLVFGSTRSGYLFGMITPPLNLATVNVTVTEVLSEDGVASLTIPASLTGVSTLNVTVTGLDGTAKTVTTNVSGPVLSVSYTPSVSGAACWCAYEMEYDSANNKTGFENSGSDNTALSSDGVTESDAFTDDGMLYTYAHPWRNMRGDNAYPSSWTAVVRCTVPAYENAAVITFGTQSGGLIGLVAGANPETQMRLVQTTGNSHFVTNATMTVQNATTAQHVYIFSVENNQTVKVYCDGDQVLNKTFDSQFTIGGGIQVGSVHGGIGSTGIVRFGKGESPANTLSETVQKAARIDCVRLYKTVLGSNAIAALTEEFPAVKLYRATVAADATTTWDALTWSPAWDDGNEYSKIILTTEGDATLTLPDSITADEFTINVASDSTLTLAKAAGGTAMTVSKLEIDDGTVAVADANFFDSRAINGTGTLKITGNGVLTSALSGNAKVEIPANVAVDVTTGSIANPITGAGTLAYQNALPATSPSFGDWTGTVKLPGFTADALNLNNYGKAGSVVEITAVNGGWIVEAGKTIAPTLKLSGNMTINAMSSWTYTFAEITGSGNLSFSTSANSPTVNITKVAEGYSGTISSTLETPVTIATLDRAAGTTVTPGSKVLSTSSGVQASALTVGGVATDIVPVFDTDGLYVKAASVTKNDATTYHNTVADALTAAGSDDATITLLAPTDNAITLAPGQTLVNGDLTTGSVTGPVGYEVVNSNGTYTLVDNRASSWAPAENSDNKWETAANWSNGVVPNTYTAVTFPASEEGHTVKLSQNDTAPQHTCASMEIIGNVTFQRIANGSWAYVLIGGNITGSGTMTLEQVGIKSTNNVTIECPVVGNATANDNFFSTGTFTFNNTVNVAAGEFKAEYADLVFGALVTLANGGYVKTHGSGSTATFNGGISVPENAAASLTVDSGTHTIASTVTLASGATLTVPTASTTVSGATFATSVADSYVKATAGESTTVYSVAAKRTATVSVGSNVSLTINGNAVADGDTVKFVPGDVLTITASADTYYTPALTVNGVAQTSPYELTTTDADVTVSVTATLDTYTITIPVVANTTVSVSYTSGGEALFATAAGDITVDAGTDMTATWTAASGYKITSGASQTLNAVASAQTLASPTVEAMGATVSDVNFSYGADYATATVTATVSGDATSATLSYGNTTYDVNVVNGTVTFKNVAVTRGSDIYAPADYTIAAKDGETAVTTTGGSGTTVAANVVAAGWINENAETSGTSAGGSWTNAEAVTYSEGKAAITDNRFEATTASTASRVVLEFNVCFSSASDADVDGTAQAAIKIGEVESAATFMVLAPNSSWTPVSNADLTPDPAETYKVVLTIDYGTGSYGVTVGDNALTNATGSASFPLAASKTSVQTIDFAGSGTLTSMKGDQVEGYMVKDNAGHWYATIQEATQAYNSANGPYTVLHSGTAPSGWSIVSEGGIDILKKLAKGFFFMAY